MSTTEMPQFKWLAEAIDDDFSVIDELPVEDMQGRSFSELIKIPDDKLHEDIWQFTRYYHYHHMDGDAASAGKHTITQPFYFALAIATHVKPAVRFEVPKIHDITDASAYNFLSGNIESYLRHNARLESLLEAHMDLISANTLDSANKSSQYSRVMGGIGFLLIDVAGQKQFAKELDEYEKAIFGDLIF